MSATLTSTDPVLTAFAEAVGSEGPVAVEGARTRWERGGPPAIDVRLVRAPTGIVSYLPHEMTVQVRAGTAVADLHAQLAEAGQRTALPERGGTVGGALAVGEDALSVLGVGRVRTALLQVRYVSAEGRVITGGGPTVKNVSGFDLPRLMVGSLGTLGLFAEVILRTNPIPLARVWLRADDVDPFAVRDALFRPGAVLWDGSRTWVLLEGHAPDVAAEGRTLRSIGAFAEVDGPPALPPHRWSLTKRDLRALDGLDLGDAFVASVGVGTVFAQRRQPTRPLSPTIRELHVRVKEAFDPQGRLNPGRDPAAG
ncbi:FAD-binding protein [Egicoccus sp. AB-alg6-2]|uniref:FAD-binding protein n=1 Tax=Egicoccus sp. AB-alg6-2 TaxID=3242692 RepID=UPI00359D3C96